MAGTSRALPDDPSFFYKLCRDGDMKKIRAFVEGNEQQVLGEMLVSQIKHSVFAKGVINHTPLHEAVVSGKPEVLKYLLDLMGNANINCGAFSGYTPLHMAASRGHSECVRLLLERGADVSCLEDYGKTPKQIAQMSSKSSTVKILHSEGELV